MKIGTTLELIVLILVIGGMIYLVNPESPPNATETVVSPVPARPATPAPRMAMQVPAQPSRPAQPAQPSPNPSGPLIVSRTPTSDLIDIGIGCTLFGGAAAGLAYMTAPAQVVAAVGAGAVTSGPALTPGTAFGVLAPALAAGCAAGAMMLPWVASLFTGKAIQPEEFAIALDRANAAFGVPVASRTDSLLAPWETPAVIPVDSRALPAGAGSGATR